MSNTIPSIKVILLGESGVGKTNLINAFCNLEFQKYSDSTSVSICNEVKYNYKNNTYTILIWDTAGQEKFRSINKFVIRDSKIVIIVYSIDNRNSFQEVDFWINYTKENLGNDNYIMALVANKIDLFEDQVVPDEEGEEAAKKYGIEFIVTSALTNKKRFQYFVNKLIADYIEKYMTNTKKSSGKENKNIKINNEENQDKKQKKKCC